jgi:hypothetical protein
VEGKCGGDRQGVSEKERRGGRGGVALAAIIGEGGEGIAWIRSCGMTTMEGRGVNLAR